VVRITLWPLCLSERIPRIHWTKQTRPRTGLQEKFLVTVENRTPIVLLAAVALTYYATCYCSPWCKFIHVSFFVVSVLCSGAHPASYPLGVKRLGRAAHHSPLSSAEVKEWMQLYLHSPIRLHGVVLLQKEARETLHFPFSYAEGYLLNVIVVIQYDHHRYFRGNWNWNFTQTIIP
jgi:hypothetical protein